MGSGGIAGDGDADWAWEEAAAETIEEGSAAFALRGREDGVEVLADGGDDCGDGFSAGVFCGFEGRSGGVEEGVEFILLGAVEIDFLGDGLGGGAGEEFGGLGGECVEAVAFDFHADEGAGEDAHEEDGGDGEGGEPFHGVGGVKMESFQMVAPESQKMERASSCSRDSRLEAERRETRPRRAAEEAAAESHQRKRRSGEWSGRAAAARAVTRVGKANSERGNWRRDSARRAAAKSWER